MKAPQLAKEWTAQKDHGVASWWASPKLDGIRAIYVPGRGFMSRSGKRLPGFDRQADALDPLCETRGLSFVDGELFIPGRTFQGVQGPVMSHHHPDKVLVEFHAFAVGGEFGDTAAMIEAIPEAPASGVHRVPYERITNTPEAVTAACERYVAQGFEGVVLRHPDVPYFHGRSDHLLKLKAIREADLAIVDMKWGTGAVSGMVGSVLVEGEIDGRLVRCWVGAGLSMEERDRLAADEAPWGKMLNVAFQSLTDEPGEDGAFALRFPRALGIKEDRPHAKPKKGREVAAREWDASRPRRPKGHACVIATIGVHPDGAIGVRTYHNDPELTEMDKYLLGERDTLPTPEEMAAGSRKGKPHAA